jgi:hypothetical protein
MAKSDYALLRNTTGRDNIAAGEEAGIQVTTGSLNIGPLRSVECDVAQ